MFHSNSYCIVFTWKQSKDNVSVVRKLLCIYLHSFEICTQSTLFGKEGLGHQKKKLSNGKGETRRGIPLSLFSLSFHISVCAPTFYSSCLHFIYFLVLCLCVPLFISALCSSVCLRPTYSHICTPDSHIFLWDKTKKLCKIILRLRIFRSSLEWSHVQFPNIFLRSVLFFTNFFVLLLKNIPVDPKTQKLNKMGWTWHGLPDF